MLPTRQPTDDAPARRRWPGIRVQLLVLLLPSLALILAIGSWSDFQDHTRTLERAFDEALLEPLSALDDSVHFDAKGAIDLEVPFAVQSMFESIQALHKHLHVGLTPLGPGATLKERTLMGVADLPVPPDAEVALSPAVPGNAYTSRIVFYTVSYRGYPLRIAALQRELQDATGQHFRLRVQAAESMDRRDDARQASLHREFRQGLLMLTVTVLIVWLGIGWALRPLKLLGTSLREHPRFELQALDAAGVPYEVAPLVDAVNQHIADYRQLLVDQGRFLADASHQLRTPLAIMTTQVGYALREHDPELLRHTLRAILAQLGRSRRLSDQLLAMAHASLATEDAEPLPLIDLNTVARAVVLQYLPLAHEKNQDLGWVDALGEDIQDECDDAQAPAVPVHAQSAEMHEVLANLVHNAIRYTPAGGSITVAVRIEGDVALAEVSDAGPGIAPELHAVVFERFSRSHAADQAGMAGGAGLGLAIARAYARRNGGDVVLIDAPRGQPGAGKGLCVRLVLPLALTH